MHTMSASRRTTRSTTVTAGNSGAPTAAVAAPRRGRASAATPKVRTTATHPEQHPPIEGTSLDTSLVTPAVDTQLGPTVNAAAVTAHAVTAAATPQGHTQTPGGTSDAALIQALVAAMQVPLQRSPHSSPTRAAIVAPRDAFRDKYAGAPGLALDSWIAKARRMLAFYDGLPDARAVAWLATGLEGAAGDWFDQFVAVKGQPPSSPDALMTALRARFQPVNAAATARRMLEVLTQGKDSVNEYTSRFHQLVAHVPALDLDSRLYRYRRGLNRDISSLIARAEPQPATLEATIALAARLEGLENEATSAGELLAAVSIPSNPSTAADTSSAYLLNRVAELEALVRALQSTQGASRGAGREDSRPQVPGLSSEEARLRMGTGRCLYCGQFGHVVRDCSDKAQMKPPTLSA